MTYNVFTRTWWKDNPEWPNGLEPHMGDKSYKLKNVSLEEAQSFCKEYNENRKPDRYERKAEYEKA